jgi:hypothetical protein
VWSLAIFFSSLTTLRVGTVTFCGPLSTDLFLHFSPATANRHHSDGEPRHDLAAQWRGPAPSRAGLKVFICSNSTPALNPVCPTPALGMPAPPPPVPASPAVLGAGDSVQQTGAHGPQVWSIASPHSLLRAALLCRSRRNNASESP